MSKPGKTNPATLKPRILKALQEGRGQIALELAKELLKHDPNEDHRMLLRQGTILRAQQLQRENHLQEAAVVWRNLLRLSDAPGIREQVAENLARCGFPAEAMGMALSLPADAPGRGRIMAALADAAVERGAAGKPLLPPELHAGFEAVLAAFEHAHQGRDEESRSAIQTIGLQSPFLEWKVFLRGLLAWYAEDDARAREAWTRLQSQRLPWRLAAPLRFAIDEEFRQTQPPATQAALQRAADRTSGAEDLTLVRSLQAALRRPKGFNEAIRVAEPLVARWRTTRPALLERLRRTLSSAILVNGEPRDFNKLTFLLKQEDIGFENSRLLAVGAERHGRPAGAAMGWLNFLLKMKQKPTFGPHQALAEAIVWERVGTNRIEMEDDDWLDPDDADEIDSQLPSAAECYDHAIELTPERRAPYFRRLEALADNPETSKEAMAAGEAMLQKFPNDLPALMLLSEVYSESRRPSKAHDVLERALALDPLNRKLRRRIGLVCLDRVIEGTRTKLATLRGELDRAEELLPDMLPAILARRYFVERSKDESEAAEAVLARLPAIPHGKLATKFSLIAEGVRFGMPIKDHKSLVKEFKSLTKEPATSQEIVLLAEMMAQESTDKELPDDVFKDAFALCKKVDFAGWSERQVEHFMFALAKVRKRTGFDAVSRKAQRLHPKNPFLILAQRDHEVSERHPSSEYRLWDLNHSMSKLLDDLPRERQEEFVEALERRGLSREDLKHGPDFGSDIFRNFFRSFGRD